MRLTRQAVLIGALALASAPGTWSAGTGSIAGTVTDAGTGAPLSGVTVTLYTCTGRFVVNARTDASGIYATAATLDTGWYLLRTRNQSGYVNELRRDRDCVGECDVIVGNPVWVDAGPRTVDFTLRPGGRISGTVRDGAGGAVPDVQVQVYDAFGTWMAYGTTDAGGVYRSGDGLLTGTYHALTGNRRHLIEELYNDIPCPFQRCDATLGTPVSVTEGVTTSKIDFALASGGRISGTVISSSGVPSTGSVTIFDANGSVTSATIGAKGRFVSETGLVTGTYFAKTSVYENDIDETWDLASCPPAAPTAGRPIAVTTGTTTSGINFTLSRGGSFAGVVSDRDTGLDIHRAFVTAYGPGGVRVGGASTDMGAYSITKLCTGSYYGVAGGPSGTAYVPDLYNETTCSACNVTLGTPISVTAGAVTAGIHFKPVPGSRISGVVTDGATRAARKGLTVSVYNALERYIGSARVDCHGNGVYLAPESEGLPPGDYLLTCAAPPNRPYPYGYRMELHDDRDCEACDLGEGDRVAVGTRPVTSGPSFDPVRRRRNGDYDRDGKGNLSLYHPDTGDWVIRAADGSVSSMVHGGPGWQPAPGDFDGDGKTDPVVYNAEVGRWRVLSSESGGEWSITFGDPRFLPVRGDWDGDGWADYGLYDGAGRWSLRVRGRVEDVAFGASGHVPVPADYDGDDKTDLALYEPASGLWIMRWSRNLTVKTATFGGGVGEGPVTGDFDGDGRADLATFRSSSATWRIRYSSDGRVVTGGFGAAGDRAVPLDYDGDGKTDLVTYGPSSGRWHVAPSLTGAPFSVTLGGGPMLPQN